MYSPCYRLLRKSSEVRCGLWGLNSLFKIEPCARKTNKKMEEFPGLRKKLFKCLPTCLGASAILKEITVSYLLIINNLNLFFHIGTTREKATTCNKCGWKNLQEKKSPLRNKIISIEESDADLHMS